MFQEATAPGWLTTLDPDASAPARRRWPGPLALGVLIGALLAIAVTSVVGAPRLELRSLGIQPARAEGWPQRDLPREWRWERKAIRFDHMFRTRR